MSNRKISELTSLTAAAGDDVLPIVDISETSNATKNKKITVSELLRSAPDGNAAAPAFSFESDAANGLYLAGTDTVGISTGGTQRVTVDGSGNVVISGDLTVQGATTTVESQTVTIDDKNIELGSIATPTNTTADGGGITLKGATDKTLKWINSTGCWTFNQPMNFNDHVRIDSSGRVGIGATVPNEKLVVSGNASVTGALQITSNTSAPSAGAFLFRPASNTLAFGSNSAERLRLDSSGNLGVGLTSLPATGFNRVIRVKSATGAAGIFAEAPDTSSWLGLYGGTSTSDSAALLYPNTGSFRIGTTSAVGTTSFSEKLRIDSSGNLGLATSSPSAPLAFGKTVYGDQTSEDFYRIKFKDFGGISNDVGIGQPDENSLAFNIQGGSTASYRWFAGTAGERMRLDGNGNLAVGSTSPQARLEVRQDSSTAYDSSDDGAQRDGTSSICITNHNDSTNSFSQLVFDTASSNQSIARIVAIRTGTSSNDLAFVVEGSNTKREAMRIDSSGNVGIGTSSPSRLLQVSGSGNQYAAVTSTTSANAGILFGDSSNDDAGYVLYANSVDALLFGTGGATERMRIDSSGRLLVGTSSARNLGRLEVEGTTFENSSISATRNVNGVGEVGINLNRTRGTSAGSMTALIANDRIGSIVFRGADGTGLVSAAQIKAEVDGTPGTNDMPGRLVFSTTADGASSPTERMRLDSDGRLGLGTTNPGANLHVQSTGDTIARVTSADGSGAFLDLGDASDPDGGRIVYDSGSNLAFSTASSERMRITSGGTLLLNGQTSNATGINTSLYTNSASGIAEGITIKSDSTSGNRFMIGFYDNGNNKVGDIVYNGTSTAYNTTSDYRLKENVVAVTDGITRIKQLNPSRFNFIGNTETTVDGFLAHEVQSVVSEAVTGDHDGVDDSGNPVYQSIDQSKLVPLLTAALQEAIAKIETLETKVAALEAQ